MNLLPKCARASDRRCALSRRENTGDMRWHVALRFPAALAASAVSAGACGPGQQDAQCQHATSGLIRVDVRDALVGGRAVATGSCTALSCVTPEDRGCSRWEGQMTGGNGASCLVQLIPPDGGQPMSKTISGYESQCDGIRGALISF